MASGHPPNSETKLVAPEQVVWRDNPYIPNGQIAVLVGDPSKPELVVMRVKFPANLKYPPHSHPYIEVATVMSGRIGLALGETFDQSKGVITGPGALGVVAANQPHYVWTENEEAIVQVQFIGPAATNFVKGADDPRGK